MLYFTTDGPRGSVARIDPRVPFPDFHLPSLCAMCFAFSHLLDVYGLKEHAVYPYVYNVFRLWVNLQRGCVPSVCRSLSPLCLVCLHILRCMLNDCIFDREARVQERKSTSPPDIRSCTISWAPTLPKIRQEQTNGRRSP